MCFWFVRLLSLWFDDGTATPWWPLPPRHWQDVVTDDDSW